MALPRVNVQRVTFASDDALNEYLAEPQQFDVIGVQHLSENFASAEDVVSNRVTSSTYMLTRAAA